MPELIEEAREKTAKELDKRYAFPMFGVECGKGWEKLYLPLFKLCKLHNINVLQVKEKFGGLRFYTGGGDPEVYDMVQDIIDVFESESYRVCEECGARNGTYKKDFKSKHEVTTEGGWLKTLCKDCRSKKDA